MLSRVAERLYWTARYLERAENTARLVKVYSNLMLDLPNGVGLNWHQLVDISGAQAFFDSHYRTSGKRNVIRFMLSDTDNQGSLLTSLTMARENIRTTRDLVPSEGWEHVNELYLFARKELTGKMLLKDRYEFLSEVVMRTQQITGLLAGTMSHGAAYQFIRVGRNLERADMTTRILDVGSATLIAPGVQLERLENRLWTYVLRSLSAHQMYRQYVRRRVQASQVLAFLLQDTDFPRAVAHTLGEIASCLEHKLPHSDEPLRAALRLQRLVAEANVNKLHAEGLHEFIDQLQLEFGNLHQQISTTWFSLELDEAV
ncbi:MAG: alpha-E domain-containing protein [Gammaproteobacteria bacterium]|nr:alpha-E domain-containing protein [Gammaproteobacteria bacterium]MDH5513624.1 alpha-E domain-containing protein [Gammaproteobacteria bacterium]